MAKPQTLLVLDVDRTCLKAVQVDTTGKRPQVVRCAVQMLSADDDPAPRLQAMLSAGAAPDEVVSAIARDQALVRLLVLPSTRSEELAQMVELQAKSQLPYAKEDVIADFLPIGRTGEGSSTVLMVGVHRALMTKHLQHLQEAGAPPRTVTLSTEGLLAWYQAQQPPAGPLTALLDLDYDAAELLICDGPACLFTRSLPSGTRLEEVQWEEALVNELERSFASFAMERRGESVGALVLTGVARPGLDERLAKRLGLSVEFRDAAEAVRTALPFEPSAAPPAQAGEVSWAVPLGLALARGRLMNLLPKTVRQERTALAERRALVTTAWLAGALLCVMGIGSAWHVSRSVGYERELVARLKETDEPARRVERLSRRLQLVRKHLAARGQVAALLQELYRVTPPRLSLGSFTMEAAHDATIKGSAGSRGDIPAYINALEASPLFEGVSLKYSTKRRAKEGELTDFEITAAIAQR